MQARSQGGGGGGSGGSSDPPQNGQIQRDRNDNPTRNHKSVPVKFDTDRWLIKHSKKVFGSLGLLSVSNDFT